MDHKVTGDRFYSHATAVGQRLSQEVPSLDKGTDAFLVPRDGTGASHGQPESKCPSSPSVVPTASLPPSPVWLGAGVHCPPTGQEPEIPTFMNQVQAQAQDREHSRWRGEPGCC